MRFLALAVVVVAPACEAPPLQITYRISTDPAAQCGDAESCGDISLACEGVFNIRIVRPTDRQATFVSLCETIGRLGDDADLCPINRIDLPPDIVLPRETLEVQMLVWPRHLLQPPEGQPICPGSDVMYDARGFPRIGQSPSPALGGSTFVEPDDEVAVVELGCTNVLSLNEPMCTGDIDISVTATIQDFDNRVSVGTDTAKRLSVVVGEPQLVDPDENRWALIASNTTQLQLPPPPAGPIPTWTAELDDDFQNYVCIQVIDDVVQPPAVVTCATKPPASPFNLLGVRLKDTTFAAILAALGTPTPPGGGLTIGMVLDNESNPVEGAVVDGANDIRYLSADRTTFTGTSTSSTGIFVSETAVFPTIFVSGLTNEAVGGAIDAKVTIVILQQSGSNGKQ